MSKMQLLRILINQRLTAAAEEIFGAVERTMAEYEENVYLSNLEIDRQRKMLDIVLNPQIKLLRAEPEQSTLSLCNEEVLEQHHSELEISPSVVQEDPQPPQVKEEPEVEQQVEQQLQWLEEEMDAKHSLFMESPVQRETNSNNNNKVITPVWEHRDHVLFPCPLTDQRTPEPDGAGCDQEGPNTCSLLLSEDGSVAGKGDGIFYKKMGAPQFIAVKPRSKRTPTDKYRKFSRPSSKLCDTAFPLRASLVGPSHRNVGSNTCKLCGKTFSKTSGLKRHMMIHTGEKPHKCSVCGKGFNQNCHLILHIRKHSGEKPFRCTVCDKRLSRNSILKQHMKSHAAEKQFCMFPMQSREFNSS